MSELSLRVIEAEARPGGSAPVHEFLREHWQRGITLTRPRFYDWQFRQSPANRGADSCLLLVDERDAIHGFMGLNKREFWIDDRSVAGCEITTWVLAESVRGLGMGRKIVQQLQTTYDVIVGMGISVDALRVYLPQGLKFLRHFPRFVKVFDPEAASPLFLESAPWSEKYLPITVDVPAAPSWTEVPVADLAPFANQARSESAMFARDVRNLEWRYEAHPVFRYHAFVLRGNGQACGIVLRVDETEGGIRYCHVMDILGDSDATPVVVPFVEEFCRANGVAFADFYCTNPRITRHLWCRGWASAVDDPFVGVSNLLHPVEPCFPATTSIIMWSRSPERTLDLSRLYITKADSDMDRPTLAYLTEKGIDL